jgi:ParB-like chromosome segregation protein Spo0J
MRQIEQFPVSIIEALPDRRAVKSDTVDRLAESIKMIGLRTPITVRIMDDFVCSDGQKADGVPVLVTGAHRLAAVKALGWETVECFMFHPIDGERGDDEITAKLWEISENLHRAELSTLERAEQIAEWVRLAEERGRISVQLAQKMATDGTARGRPEGGVSAASRELGLDRYKVRRSVKIAALPEEAKKEAEALGLSDNQSALERATKADNPVFELKKIAEEKRRADYEKLIPPTPARIGVPIDSPRSAVRALLRVFSAAELFEALESEQRESA